MQYNETALAALEDSSIPFLFLTGKAGTGKSTLVRHWVETTKKRVIKLAPTGIAAINIAGTTIHKFFNLIPPKPYYWKDYKSVTKVKADAFDVILIDEISMVRSDIMQTIYNTLTYSDRKQRPWGGKLIRVVGDLSQLPPVVQDRTDMSVSSFLHKEYGGVYFFNACCFQTNHIELFELTQVYRQDGIQFLNMLDFMRQVDKTPRLQLRLREVLRSKVLPAPVTAIWLCTTKARVAEINQAAMEEVDGEVHVLTATVDGKIKVEDVPVESEIELKLGCRVIIRANDQDYVNGEMGTFLGIQTKQLTYHNESGFLQTGFFRCLVIETERGIRYVRKYAWVSIEYKQDKNFMLEEDIVGSFIQYPVMPAYAITIHKSQGLTLNQIHIDFERGCFSPGQAYVAFSRCRSLEGITLQTPVQDRDFYVDPKITEINNYTHERTAS